MSSQIVGVLAAASQKDADAQSIEKGRWVAQQAILYNNLNHAAAEKLLKEIKDCRAAGGCSESKLKSILGKYESLSAERSNAINACGTRACVDKILNSSIRMDDPVSQELLGLLRQTTYDTPGLLQGNPDLVSWQSPNPSGWGDTFALDKQQAFAKNLKEGWLTPQELADLDRWNDSTSWVDRSAGRKLEPKEKASILLELGTAAAMALMGGRGSVGGAAKGRLTPKDFPEVAAQVSRQKQLRHLEGTTQLADRGKGGYMSNAADAQKVLDAYRSGNAVILGKNAHGFPVVRVDGVTGTNVNIGAGIKAQPTNVFVIKGTTSPSIVPTSPNPKLVD